MASGNIKLVTFDVMQTICKVSRSVGSHYAQISQMYGIPADETSLNKAFKEKYPVHWKRSPNFGVDDKSTPFKWWSSLVKDCFKSAGITDDEQRLSQISSHLYLHFTSENCWEVLPNVTTALNQIKSLNLQMGVISNADERLHKILRNIALKHYFDFVLASSEVGVAKPSVGIFSKAIELANIGPHQAVHLGDNIENDYLAPRQAGWRSFLLSSNKNINNVNPKHIVSDIMEFYTKLKEL